MPSTKPAARSSCPAMRDRDRRKAIAGQGNPGEHPDVGLRRQRPDVRGAAILENSATARTYRLLHATEDDWSFDAVGGRAALEHARRLMGLADRGGTSAVLADGRAPAARCASAREADAEACRRTRPGLARAALERRRSARWRLQRPGARRFPRRHLAGVAPESHLSDGRQRASAGVPTGRSPATGRLCARLGETVQGDETNRGSSALRATIAGVTQLRRARLLARQRCPDPQLGRGRRREAGSPTRHTGVERPPRRTSRRPPMQAGPDGLAHALDDTCVVAPRQEPKKAARRPGPPSPNQRRTLHARQPAGANDGRRPYACVARAPRPSSRQPRQRPPAARADRRPRSPSRAVGVAPWRAARRASRPRPRADRGLFTRTPRRVPIAADEPDLVARRAQP